MGPLTENVESFGLSLDSAAEQPVVLVDATREVKDTGRRRAQDETGRSGESFAPGCARIRRWDWGRVVRRETRRCVA